MCLLCRVGGLGGRGINISRNLDLHCHNNIMTEGYILISSVSAQRSHAQISLISLLR